MIPKSILEMVTFRKVFSFFLVINFTTRLILLLRPLPYLDGKLLPDDAYISLEIAKNIAQGNGPFYTDSYTNGFQPLYVFLMTPVYVIFPHQDVLPVKIGLFLLSLFDTATLALLMLWIQRLTLRPGIAGLVAILWIFNDYIIRTSLNGLETIMASFFIVLACYFFYRLYRPEIQRKSYHFLMLGAMAGFACLARVDSGILVAVLGVLILLNEYSNFRVMLVRSSLYSAGMLSIFSIWIIYSLYYTGNWYPESGTAVRFSSLANTSHTPPLSWYAEMVERAVLTERYANGVVCLMIMILIIPVLTRKKQTRSFLKAIKQISPLLLFSILLVFAYTFYVFTFWYFERYFFPITILLLLIFALLINTLLSNMQPTRKILSYGIIMIIWVSTLFTRGKYLDYFIGAVDPNIGYMNLGLWAKKNFSDSTVLGSSQSGALKYFAPNLKVVNLDGVVNKLCFKSLVEGKNMDYIRQSGVDYVLGWDVNIDFIKKHSTDFRESDLILERKIEGFQSWNHTWYVYRVNK